MLETVALTKSFGGVRAVSEIGFSVPEGQWLGIIGPNGAGKTTLFNMLGGQIRPTAGTIRLAGVDVTNDPPHRRYRAGLGRSFQIASLFRGLTVVEHVTLALRAEHRRSLIRPALGSRALRARVEATLEAWDLADVREVRRPDDLSYGAQRRLELALALAGQPRLLLLDEPNVGLTTREVDDLLARLKRVADDLTVIFVAHDVEMVLGWSHRVLVMHFGELVADETPDALLRNTVVGEIYLGSTARSEKGVDDA